nr:aminodeoxychorismate/anthranilate synthase component II [uncultured Butyrivibrio sp.]
MILLIDNYDSFSYNLYQMIGDILAHGKDASGSTSKASASAAEQFKVIRNDELTVSEIRELAPSKIIISPGPGRPEDAGVIIDVVKELGKDIPILGVCLGHQAICAAFGGTITYAKELMHGKQSVVTFDTSCPVFSNLEKEGAVARYHSLALDPNTLPDCLKVTATTKDGEIMAVSHKDYQIYGMQFHPESILTPMGKKMLQSFIDITAQNK